MLRTAHLTTHAQKGSVLQALHHDCVQDIRHTTSKHSDKKVHSLGENINELPVISSVYVSVPGMETEALSLSRYMSVEERL